MYSGHPRSSNLSIARIELLPKRVLGSLHFIMQIKIFYLLQKHLERVCMEFHGMDKCNFFRKVFYI